MTHDPLCPYVQTAHQRDHVACQCDLIAKVRAEKLDDLHAKSFREGSEDMLAKCIAAVEFSLGPAEYKWARIKTVDTLRALQEKP